MKRTMTTVGALLVSVTPVLAAGAPEPAETGLLVCLFIAFGLLIILCQSVPGAVLFCSLIRTLVSNSTTKTEPAAGR